MARNILITGGAGYIGGSIVAAFLSRTTGPLTNTVLSTAVRTEEQAQRLSKLGINVIQLDLHDETAVENAVLGNEIDIVVHTASSIVSSLAENLIRALGRRRQATGRETYFVHTGVTALFAEENGWTYGEVADTDADIFEKEKEIGGPNPVRVTDVLVMEKAKEHGVTAFNVVVPNVYGRGSGEVRRLSGSIPAYIRTAIKHKTVYKFEHNGSPPGAHISDITELYTLLVEKILLQQQQEPLPPSNEQGYYFAMAHRIPWWVTMDRIAGHMHARGLVADPHPQTWPSYDAAADSLEWPRQYVRAMGTSTGQLVAVNAFRQLGWQPKWDEKRFLEGLDDEVQDVLELDTVKATLFQPVLGRE
ncbi:NAD(P)-binding protein [Parachaetomium inaequale]|uniref:NAD(P)-binding protein n=1 Tax=Parachaetomium inaequale TaxID=2588326 RepID=A0AAN6PLS1_9PEZI|nr:NAD(P)-binding protein [Parachaetomium inaequale]